MAQTSSAKISAIGLSKKNHDHSSQKKRMARIKGQFEGIERMIDEGRYCPEIIQQIKAARSALKSLEMGILETHLKGCVRTAFSTKSIGESDKKIEELINLMKSSS